jgi:hypothetical protein
LIRHARKGRKASRGWHNGLKSKSFPPPTLPSIPSLTTPQGPATTLEAKCDTRKACFFPPIPPADLFNIPHFQYCAEKSSSLSTTLEEIAFALSKACPHNAPGPEGIPMYFLKLMGWLLLEYLQPLFQACFHLSFHPLHLKQSSTVALMKPGTGNNSAHAAW